MFMRKLLLFFILFGIEFDLDFGIVSIRKVVLIISVLFILYKKIDIFQIKKSLLLFTTAMSFVWIYSCIILLTVGEQNIYSPTNIGFHLLTIFLQIIWFAVFPFLLTLIFEDINELLSTQLAVILFQSIIAILGKLSVNFRMFIYPFSLDDGRLLEAVSTGVRVPIIGSIGATASVILSMGGMICLYFILKYPQRCKKYFFYYGIICLAQAFIGRTGLYFSCILFTAFTIYSVKKKTYLKYSLGLIFIAFFLVIGYLMFVPESQTKERTVQWVGELFIRNSSALSTVQTILAMEIPPLSWDTFVGTGLVGGITVSRINICSDVGYVQTYAAIGLIGAIAYYGIIYGYMLSAKNQNKNRQLKLFLTIYFLYMVVIECKEPFLRKTPCVMFYVAICLLASKNYPAAIRNA